MNKLIAAILALLPLVAFVSSAASGGALAADWQAWAADQFLPLLLLTAIGFVLFGTLATLGSAIVARENQLARERGEPSVNAWQVIRRRLYNPVPMTAERDALLDHDYDGIKELDNSLPPWWLYTFYASIGFGVAYMALFWLTDNALRMRPAYEREMAEAREAVEAYLATQANLVDETTAELLTDVAALSRGEETFQLYCAACHAADGGGGVGPNLTDAYWLHGDGSLREVFATVKHGVPEKGMIAWKSQLSAAQIHEVASFVTTLAGSTPAAPKDPQGQLVESPTAEPDALEGGLSDASAPEGRENFPPEPTEPSER